MSTFKLLKIKKPIYKRISRRNLMLIIGGVILVLAGLVFVLIRFHLLDSIGKESEKIETLGISTKPITSQERDSYQVPAENPRYISIPAAGVDKARVIGIGLKAPNPSGQQQMDEPHNTSDVGWYNCQINPVANKRCAEPIRPGAGNTKTSVVMDGHTCFSDKLTCVFDKLSSLKNNDKISIELGNGNKISYTIKKVDILNLKDVDMAKAMVPIESNKEGLMIITCSGSYNGTKDANGINTASQRILVYAVRD